MSVQKKRDGVVVVIKIKMFKESIDLDEKSRNYVSRYHYRS